MLLRLAAVALFAASSLLAQGVNCQLLGSINQYAAAQYNDVWGYAAPNGKEYAFVGTTIGTSVVDVSIPSAPVERAFIPGPTSTWRDIRTYSTYAYVVTEGGGGFQVIDMTNPDAPFLARTVGAADFGNCHNICVDLGTGRIYCVGTNNGTPVYDAAANPANPPLIGNLLPRNATNPNSTYFHDICVENGFAYGAMIYNGVLRVMDLTALPAPILSNSGTPGVFTHNCWPNAAGTVCVTTDEVSGGVIKFFDITNKSAPIARGQFTPNPGSIPHNAFIVGNLCHVSWYTEGYRCIDISNPSNPVEVASYDTWPGASGGFNGAWGVYPFLPSGNILVNDISTGLYIVRPQITDLALQHTPLVDTVVEDANYSVVATVTGTNPLSAVNLVYQVGSGAPVTVPMVSAGAPTIYVGSIPAQNAPQTVRYHIECQDSVGTRRSPNTGDHEFFVGTRVRAFFDNCETDPGWTHGFVTTQDDWQRGAPAGRSGTSGGFPWADPGGAYSGTACWGTDLGGAGFNGSYQNNVSNWLLSPVIPTNGIQGLRLRYRRWASFNTGDTGRVLVNGTLVATVPSLTAETAWTLVDHDISSIANAASTVQVRFELLSNATNVAGGWQIDDIEIGKESDFVPATTFGVGTAGTGGVIPQLALNGTPRIGLTPSLEATQCVGGSLALLAVGFAQTSFPALGVQVLVDTTNGFVVTNATSGAAGAAGAGSASFPLSIPNDPFLDNLYVYSQAAAFDAGSVGGTLSASAGLRFRVCLN